MTIKKVFIISIFLFIISQLPLKAQLLLNEHYSIGKLRAFQKSTADISFSDQIAFLPLSFSGKDTPLPSDFNFKNNLHAPCIYSYDDLAFFCKIEVKLEKASRIPFKFRLGSVDYVDQMEGKRRTY